MRRPLSWIVLFKAHASFTRISTPSSGIVLLSRWRRALRTCNLRWCAHSIRGIRLRFPHKYATFPGSFSFRGLTLTSLPTNGEDRAKASPVIDIRYRPLDNPAIGYSARRYEPDASSCFQVSSRYRLETAFPAHRSNPRFSPSGNCLCSQATARPRTSGLFVMSPDTPALEPASTCRSFRCSRQSDERALPAL